MFDLADLDLAEKAETPFEFELEHPETKDGLGVFVSVIGSESRTFLDYVRQEGNRARKRAFEAQRKGKAEEPMSVEDQESAILNAVAVCVVKWRTGNDPWLVWSGEKLECTRDNVVKVLRSFRWMRDQINAATGDVGNFLHATSKPSSPLPETSSN